MISYSQEEMQRELISDQRLWKRLPVAAAAILWPIEAILLGWGTASWVGLATVVIAVTLSTSLPAKLSINLYLVDLLEQFLRLPLWLGWLVLVWHLSVREPIYPILGVPAAGAILVTAITWLVAQTVILAVRFATRRAMASGRSPGA